MDIDIDTQSSFDPLDIFPTAIKASMIKDEKITKHPVGVYFQTVPINPLNNLSSIPYKEGDKFNLFKLDFLHLNILDSFSSKAEIRRLIKTPPNWDLLQDEEIVNQLFQISNQFQIIDLIRPKSIQQLADCIALIRPGKRHLLDKYIQDPDNTRPNLYKKTDKYYFKKGHAISYALTIVLQLHLIQNQHSTENTLHNEFEY